MTNGWGGPESFQIAMTKCCAVAVALFGGYFLAAYLINETLVRYLKMPSRLPDVQQFAGYALVVIFLLRIVIGLLPDFHIIALLLQFYTVYVIWEGCEKVLRVRVNDRLRFTLIASVLLIACPALVEWMFNELTVVLN